MTWHADRERHQATTREGYRITWARHPAHGLHFNAYSPRGKHLEASYDHGKCKAACDAHLAAQTPQLDFSSQPHAA